jgi:hypothetical protein
MGALPFLVRNDDSLDDGSQFSKNSLESKEEFGWEKSQGTQLTSQQREDVFGGGDPNRTGE